MRNSCSLFRGNSSSQNKNAVHLYFVSFAKEIREGPLYRVVVIYCCTMGAGEKGGGEEEEIPMVGKRRVEGGGGEEIGEVTVSGPHFLLLFIHFAFFLFFSRHVAYVVYAGHSDTSIEGGRGGTFQCHLCCLTRATDTVWITANEIHAIQRLYHIFFV